jgi:hypothetical protein
VFAAIKEEKDPKLAEARVRKELAAAPDKLTPEQIDQQARIALSPWFRYFLTYDPAPTLSKVRIPVLALNGERDLQVPAAENIQAIKAALAAGGNKDYTAKILPHNHLFQSKTARPPNTAPSSRPSLRPLTMISDWIRPREAPPRRASSPRGSRTAADTKSAARSRFYRVCALPH